MVGAAAAGIASLLGQGAGNLAAGNDMIDPYNYDFSAAAGAAIEAIRGSNNSSALTSANLVGSTAIAVTLPTQSKFRRGIARGGPSGTRTSVASRINHNAAQVGKISIPTRNLVTKGLRRVPYLGTGLGVAELLGALYDRFDAPCEK